jgi:hypothetical protein
MWSLKRFTLVICICPLWLALLLLVSVSCNKKDKATGPDTTPPSVVSTIPLNGATGVSINSSISATFSEAVRESTLTASTFKVESNVTGSLALGNGGKTVTFTPTTNLHYSTTYTVTITTGIRDLAGNALKANYVWTFTTGASPVPSANFPLSAGKRWLYSANTKYGYISGYGGNEWRFVGDYALYVLDDLILNGKSATRLFLVKIPTSQVNSTPRISISRRMLKVCKNVTDQEVRGVPFFLRSPHHFPITISCLLLDQPMLHRATCRWCR